jgi:serine/threonine-protein kinase
MLLRGATLRANGQLQVSVYLVSSRTGRTVWSNTYRTALHQAANVFAMQDEIFADIARQLRVTVGDTPSASPSHLRTDNLKALTLYWQGQALFDGRTPDGVRKAREYLTKSIEVDSNFAQAHIALAEVYNTYAIGNLGDYRPSEYYPQARSHAEHALVLDPGAADAHAILGAVRLLFEFDWVGAEAELKQALELNPRSANAHLWLGTLYGFTGRSDAGVTSALEGLSVDPRSLYANVEVGRALILDRKYDLAAERFKQLIERDSNAVRSHLLLGQVFEQTGKYDSAVVEMQTAIRLAPRSSRVLAYLAHAHALAGDTIGAVHGLDLLLERSRTAYVPAFDFAVVCVGLGRIDETFEWLEKSLADHSLRPYFMDATFDPIRSDPRYKPFLRKLNLPLGTTTR